MRDRDGSAAFPVPGQRPSDGMSLRDYFAAQAIQGAADSVCDQISPACDPAPTDAEISAHCERHAHAAYLLADAMLAERAKVGTL